MKSYLLSRCFKTTLLLACHADTYQGEGWRCASTSSIPWKDECCVALLCNIVLHVALIFDMDYICTVFHKFPDFVLDFTTCRTYPRNHVLILEDSPRSMKDKELPSIFVNFQLKIRVGHAKGGKSVTSFELVLEHFCCGNRFKNCIYFSVNYLTIQRL